MHGDEIIKLACKENAAAESFCRAWATFVHTLDDCVDADKALSPDAVAGSFTSLIAELAGNPFFLANKAMLFSLMIQSANYWSESHGRKPNERDVIKGQWHSVIYQVAYILGGWQFLREVTHKAMEFDYEPERATQTIPKPPLGIKPIWLHQEERLRDLNEAIARYDAEGKHIPTEWISERNSVESFLRAH